MKGKLTIICKHYLNFDGIIIHKTDKIFHFTKYIY